MKEDLSNERVACRGKETQRRTGERMAACGFSYMGQRGARGQSLRASWQWQRQCQTLEEERTCTMVSPTVWKHDSMASLLGLEGLDSFSHFQLQTVFSEWIVYENPPKTNYRVISSHWYWESASDLLRPDKVSKSLIAHFWDSKLLMITVRLSARHSAPAEPLPVAKVTNPGGRGGERRGWDINWELSQLWSNMRHQRLESNKSKPRVEGKKQSDAECSGTEMCNGNTIKILHKHKLKKQQHWLDIFPHLRILAGHATFFVHPNWKSWDEFAPVSPLNEQPCRKRWRGGEEALWKVNKRHEGSGCKGTVKKTHIFQS